MVPSPVGLPWPVVVMISRDHGIVGLTVAFFKESMRRDAITGIRIVFALRATSRCQYKSHDGHFGVEEKEDLPSR